mgnify:CR=1 FL=1
MIVILKTIENYPQNCSSAEFENIDAEKMFALIRQLDDCVYLELLKRIGHGEENEINSDEKDEEIEEGGDVMKVIKEQVKGILKLIKTSTGNDISDDGNIIIAYINVFQIKPDKK